MYILAAFVLGCLLWYFVFYYRFADRTLVNELRKAIEEGQKAREHLSYELEEYLQQNEILRLKVQELLTTNNDFSKVVSELSRYYYNMKKWSEKAEELAWFFRAPDPAIEAKLKEFDENRPHVTMRDVLSGEKKSFF